MRRRLLLSGLGALILTGGIAISIGPAGALRGVRAASARSTRSARPAIAPRTIAPRSELARTLRSLLRPVPFEAPPSCSASGDECVRGCAVPVATRPTAPLTPSPGCSAASLAVACLRPIAARPGAPAPLCVEAERIRRGNGGLLPQARRR
jgi:hypothetical protein